MSQPKSLPTATSELHALLALPALASVPLLVLANKNDLPDAVGVDALIREMRLGEIGGRIVSVSRYHPFMERCWQDSKTGGAEPVLSDLIGAEFLISAIRRVTRRNIISTLCSRGSHNEHTEQREFVG